MINNEEPPTNADGNSEKKLELNETDDDEKRINDELSQTDDGLLNVYRNKPTPLSLSTLVEATNENEPIDASLYVTTSPSANVTRHPPPSARSRNDSIKMFTDKVKSFSNDILRTIESAHELVDLKNSNFSAATHTAAVQQYQQNQADNYLSRHAGSSFKTRKQPNSNEDSWRKPRASTDIGGVSVIEPGLLSASLDIAPKSSNYVNDIVLNLNESNLEVTSSKSVNEDAYLKTNSLSRPKTKLGRADINKSADFGASKRGNRTLDELHALNSDYGKSGEDGVEGIDVDQAWPEASEANLPKTVDEHDFRVRKRYIFKNGSKKAIPDDIHISILEVFIYLWGVTTFFADLISDVILSIEYFHSSRTWLGAMTLLFVIVPNVTLSLFSLSWYIDKYYTDKQMKKAEQHEQSKISSTCDSITFWITTIFFVVFQLDLVWKYIQGFVYTLKGWACRSIFHNLKWEKYYIEKQIKCDTDIGMLRLIDVFMDSGPQVLLQLYVITTQNLNKLGIGNLVVFTFKDFQTTSTELKQFVSIVSSLFSMGYALAGYHRCLRNQQFIFCLETNKPLPRPMSWLSTIMQFLWYLFLIAPRVLALAIFASAFRSWFFMIIFTHWLIMYFWILRLKTNYCITSEEVYSAREEIFEKFYDFVCSFIYIFVYFNLKAGPTRLRYLIYYILFYAENVLFCVCYFLFTKETNYTYKLIMMLIVIFGFWIAITFQIVYYLHCHPSHDITVCVRKKTKFHFIHKEMLKPSQFSDSALTRSENEMVVNLSQKENELNEEDSAFKNKAKYDKPSKFSFRNRFSKKPTLSEEEQQANLLKEKQENGNNSSSTEAGETNKPISTPLMDKIEKVVSSPTSLSSFLSFSSYSSSDVSKYHRSKLKKKSPDVSLIASNPEVSLSNKCMSSVESLKSSYNLDVSMDGICPPIAKMNELNNSDYLIKENDEKKLPSL